MKEFKFNNEDRRWDRFRSFHSWSGNLVEFETGEVMVMGHPDPDNRYGYTRFGIQLVTTSDPDCPNLYFDKECTEPVKKAWLTWKGQQHLAIDHEQKVAIRLGSSWRKHGHPSLGEHVRQATAYWAGAERRPVPLSQITIHTPDNEWKKKVQPVLNKARTAVVAAFRMKEDKHRWWNVGKHDARKEWQDSSVEDIVAEICGNEHDMKAVAEHGFKLPRKCERVDFLYTKGEK